MRRPGRFSPGRRRRSPSSPPSEGRERGRGRGRDYSPIPLNLDDSFEGRSEPLSPDFNSNDRFSTPSRSQERESPFMTPNAFNQMTQNYERGRRVRERESPPPAPLLFSSPSSPSSPSSSLNSVDTPLRDRRREEEYDVECINTEDYFDFDNFPKEREEFKEDNRVIILSEGSGKNGHCFKRTNLIRYILEMHGGNEDQFMMGPYPETENRYFKLPVPSYWIDLNGMWNLFRGWKVLRLQKAKVEAIGSDRGEFVGAGTIHGTEEQIYTLVKPSRTKFQGKNKGVLRHQMLEDGSIFFEADQGFLEFMDAMKE